MAASILLADRKALLSSLEPSGRHPHRPPAILPPPPPQLAAVKLAGPQRPKHDYILAHIAEELGESQDVAAALSGIMQIPVPLLQQRIKELVRPARRAGAGAAAAPGQPPAPNRLRRSLQGAWCRQCRTYACRLHAAAPLPVAGPMAPRWADGGNGAAPPAPCGPSCVRASDDGQGAGPAQAAPGAEGTLGAAGPGIQGAGTPPVPTQGVAVGLPAWSEWEAGLLAEGVRVWGCGNPCALASMIGTRSCAEVAAEVARRFPGATHGSPTKPPAYHRRKPAWGKRIRPTVTQDRLRRTDPVSGQSLRILGGEEEVLMCTRGGFQSGRGGSAQVAVSR